MLILGGFVLGGGDIMALYLADDSEAVDGMPVTMGHH